MDKNIKWGEKTEGMIHKVSKAKVKKVAGYQIVQLQRQALMQTLELVNQLFNKTEVVKECMV